MKSIATDNFPKTETLHIYRTTSPVDVRVGSNRNAALKVIGSSFTDGASINSRSAIVYRDREFLEQDLLTLPAKEV